MIDYQIRGHVKGQCMPTTNFGMCSKRVIKASVFFTLLKLMERSEHVCVCVCECVWPVSE